MSVASRIRDKLKNNLESSGGHSVVTSGTKVIRYRAGQRPDYAEAEDEQDSHFSNIQNQKSIKEAEANDPRLARFKNRSSNQDEPQSVEERKASRRRHHDEDIDNDTTTTTITSRRIQKTEIIKEDDNNNNTKKDDNEEDGDDDDDDDRRRRAKERYLKKKEEEEQNQKELEEKQQPFKDIEDESEEEGTSSEYETDSEEDDDNEYWDQPPIFRPTFIKKDDRGTIKTDEQWEKEEQEQQAQLEREKEQRKIEAHRKLKDELDRDRKEQEAKELEQKEEEEYDDDEDQDGSKKLLWIQRELERVRLEIHTRLLAEFEKKEFARRRAMTDDQILKEDPSRSRANIDNSQKKQLKFLQRDYHRGAFFQDDEYIKNKDFSAPTGEDKFNRELLPKVMQVKNFGKAGRTKYTHLKDQDTTEKDSLWNTNYNNNNNNKKYNNSNSSNNNRDYNYRDRDNSNNEMKNIKLEDIKKSINENVGGLGNTVSFIVDRINDLFNLDGLDIIENIIINDGNGDQFYPCNTLINGRSGIGKSLLIKSILTKLSINYKIINSSNLFQKDDGDTEKLIESIFNTASSQSPFVLVFEEIDSISQIRNDSLGYIEQRVVSNFLTLLENNSKKRSVFVIGVTSRIESIDTAFFSIGKFDSVLNLPIPSPNDRKEILYLLFKKFPNFNNNEIHYKELSEYLGECTHGYVGSDLNSLCKEAILVNIKRNHCNDGGGGGGGYNLIEKFDFDKAFELVKPSILNQYKLPTNIGYGGGGNGFNEIGGLDEIIEKIKSSILTPMLNKNVLDRLGIKSPSGILLYGPPGNGKSLIARAIASSSPNINFISISSTDIIDPVVGASEKNLSKLFKTLRESSPCILFLDQVEVLAKLRGFDDSSEQSSDRLLSCLLTEIDGIYGGSSSGGSNNNNNQSIVLAATTRIDLLDPSILRPGRFDYHIEIPNPNKEARLDIFKKITKSMPLDESVDFIQLSELTQGFNGADINNLCKETALLALRNDININNISMSNFLDALKFTKSSSTK
ncbi:hypothetical protein ACTFIY_007799 [Dictyostelium cf. discoideum]